MPTHVERKTKWIRPWIECGKHNVNNLYENYLKNKGYGKESSMTGHFPINFRLVGVKFIGAADMTTFVVALQQHNW